jgi:hypothetical protein
MNANSINSHENSRILRELASAQPGFAEYCKNLPPSVDVKADLPSELLADILTVLEEDEDTVLIPIDDTERMFTYAVPGLLEVGTLVAALFLLRSHIKIKRNASGKLEFLFEHKPMSNELLKDVMGSIGKLLKRA